MRPLVILALAFAALPLTAQTTPSAPSNAGSPMQAQAAPAADEIIAQEQLLWKAYASGDVPAFGSLMQPDFVSIAKKISTRDEVLTEFTQFHRTCSVAPVNMISPQVMLLSPDVATITYNARFSTTCDNRVAKISINVSTVWVRRQGDWKMHLHTEFVVNGFSVQSQ
jgi:uncharacterized protein (TIGR02246 family)